jgi:hypothetical protein
MSSPFGYLVSTKTFDEDDPSWIHALALGKFNHPTHGEIEITPERVERFADNVNNRVRGIDIDIDYDHKAKDTAAAGWVRAAQSRDDGLWLQVDWTDRAKAAIKSKEYRYFSPEYRDEWNEHKDVLFGGGLTNRPFLKDLVPLNLSEYAPATADALATRVTYNEFLIEQELYTPGIELRDIPQSARKAASAGSFAGRGRSFPILVCEDVTAASRAMGRAGPSNFDTATLKSNIIRIAKAKGFTRCLPKAWQSTQSNEGGEMKAEELAEIFGIELSEGMDEDTIKTKLRAMAARMNTEPTEEEKAEEKAKSFAEQFPEEAKALAEAESKIREAEADKQVASWVSKGLPPVVAEELKGKLAKGEAISFSEVMDKVLETGLVEFDEKGQAKGGGETPGEDKFAAAVAKKLGENEGMDYSTAFKLTAQEEPGLYSQYIHLTTYERG